MPTTDCAAIGMDCVRPVHVDIDALGERATTRPIGAVASGPRSEPVHEVLPTQLVVRRCGGAQQGAPRVSSRPLALSSHPRSQRSDL